MVAELQGQVAGFVACLIDGTVGSIGLLGVADNARGLGVGHTMIISALDWFRMQGCTSVQVVTQGRNIAAQRLYQRCGFITLSVQLWYHLWLDTN